MPEHVTLFEVGPRDGLQNEKTSIPSSDKIALINGLSQCGFSKIEVASFVSPKWVPQMADSAAVLAGITRVQGVAYTALTPNMRGFEAAMAADADEVAIFASASEGFSQKNINCSIAQSLLRFQPVLEAAQKAKIPVRAYVSCVTDCPYDGPTPPAKVAEVAAELVAMGCYELSLGETLGAGTPKTVDAMLEAVLKKLAPEQVAGHFHDTHGRALANIQVCLDKGVRTFDSSIAGLGGCPYAPGAKGNVATEALVAMLHAQGFATGIDNAALESMLAFARSLRAV